MAHFSSMLHGSSNTVQSCRESSLQSPFEAKLQKVPNYNDTDAKLKQQNQQCTPKLDNENVNIVNWMYRDETEFLCLDNHNKVDDSGTDYGNPDDDGESFDDNDSYEDEDGEESGIAETSTRLLMSLEESENKAIQFHRLEKSTEALAAHTCLNVKQEEHGNFSEGKLLPVVRVDKHGGNVINKRENGKHKFKVSKKLKRYKPFSGLSCSGHENPLKGSGNVFSYRNPTKVPFCSREVKRIMESELLSLKNAQTHTMRKIIVFASLGIRHGCEDMYELDFNQFSILRKGEPSVSLENPGVCSSLCFDL
ncbi:hypothetical protein AMTR_s00037p00132790 [Amborella trichopoda]|uniref:Uncharacterized protein n=1 Tax=Amborella trichopoda TaxID=13333 RepID=U5D4G9_AMBTC|nr:hypothetical protein AMTR_s00037p00132790 [Amborella trichopoda]